MVLATGNYTISSLFTQTYVGTFPGNDDQGDPLSTVASLAPGTQPFARPYPREYNITAFQSGYPVGYDGYYLILDSDADENVDVKSWVVTNARYYGADHYTITASDHFQHGWVNFGPSKGIQVSWIQLHPLVVGAGWPPYYPPEEVFVIKPLNPEA